MHKGLGHRLDVTAADGLQTSKVKLSANTAHIVRFKSRLAQSFPLLEPLRLLLKYESQSLKNKALRKPVGPKCGPKRFHS